MRGGEESRRAERLQLLLLWAIVAGANLFKPVHLDDPTFLGIARQVLADPLHPMAADLVLGGFEVPIPDTHEPHLVLYGYAAVMAVFGESVLALHLFHALFSGVALGVFFYVARRLCGHHALALTALFGLGPAFLPGQNLMLDVPLVAAWLACFAILLFRLDGPDGGRWFAAAACAAAAGLLVKYTTLAILPVLLLPIVLRRAWRWLPALAIPLSTLAAWSLFNWLDYGQSHLLSRPRPGFDPCVVAWRAQDWLRALGAVSPFAPVLFIPWARGRPLPALGLGAVVLAAASLPVGPGADDPGWPWLARGFFANGVLTLGLVAASFDELRRQRLETALLLGLWIAGGAAFIVLFTPFMAVRHVLLVLPPILFLLGRQLPPAEIAWRRAACAVGVVLGVALAASDYAWADLQRRQAERLVELFPAGTRIYYVGNWGWDWHAERAGALPYVFGRTRLEPGDRIVVAEKTISDGAALTLFTQDARHLRVLSEPPPRWAAFRLMKAWHRGGGYYGFRDPGLPWTLDRRPIERFLVFGPRRQAPDV